ILGSSYIDTKKLPCLWFEVDTGDADPPTFFYYMRLAAQSLAPHRKNSLPLLTPEYLLGVPTFTRRYFEKLYQSVKPPFHLVLDNFQEAEESSDFQDVVRTGLEVIPNGVRVIVISRSKPAASLARLRANKRMMILGWEELQLTRDEARGIISLGKTIKCSQESIDLNDRTVNGWAAGLTLILEQAKRGRFDLSKSIDFETVFEYFDSEVLPRLDSKTQEFLFKTSLLRSIEPVIAERLTGFEEAEKFLSKLYKNNIFTEKRFHSHSVYQYHPLFREFLIAKAQTFINKEQMRHL